MLGITLLSSVLLAICKYLLFVIHFLSLCFYHYMWTMRCIWWNGRVNENKNQFMGLEICTFMNEGEQAKERKRCARAQSNNKGNKWKRLFATHRRWIFMCVHSSVYIGRWLKNKSVWIIMGKKPEELVAGERERQREREGDWAFTRIGYANDRI